MRRLKFTYILFFLVFLILGSSIPETSVAAEAPRRSYHRKHFKKKYKRNYKKRYTKKRRTIPKDYIIKNKRRYKAW
ncbi:MAG: hypothetical protein AB9842_06740 [Bacteroidales bacterium]